MSEAADLTDRELVARLREQAKFVHEYFRGKMPTITDQAADRIEALTSDRDAWKARAEAAELRLAKAERLLKPFADAVYNDNGDVTVSTGNIAIADYFAAYKFLQHEATP